MVFCWIGAITSPVVGAIIGVGNSAVVIGLWPAHFIWTCYCVAKYASILSPFLQICIFNINLGSYLLPLCSDGLCFFFDTELCSRTKKLGLGLKVLLLVVLLPVPLVLWPVLGIVGSLLVGIAYGFLAPLLATFHAVGENVTDKFFHCFVVSHSFSFPFALYESRVICLWLSQIFRDPYVITHRYWQLIRWRFHVC